VGVLKSDQAEPLDIEVDSLTLSESEGSRRPGLAPVCVR
jgi:hypothetical protein